MLYRDTDTIMRNVRQNFSWPGRDTQDFKIRAMPVSCTLSELEMFRFTKKAKGLWRATGTSISLRYHILYTRLMILKRYRSRLYIKGDRSIFEKLDYDRIIFMETGQPNISKSIVIYLYEKYQNT